MASRPLKPGSVTDFMAELEAAEAAAAAAVVEESPMPPSASEAAPPDTPATDLKPPPVPRKSGRPVKRQSRLGRNQYTRDSIPAANGASPAPNGDTPNSPQVSATNGATNGHDSSDGTTGHKTIKSKNWRLDKLSWNEIRRPAGAMQTYIAQRQVEMAVGVQSTSTLAVQSPTINGEPSPKSKVDGGLLDGFRELSTLQMMDDLSRELVHWQRMVAEQKEK